MMDRKCDQISEILLLKCDTRLVPLYAEGKSDSESGTQCLYDPDRISSRALVIRQ